MLACLREVSRDNARTPMQWNTEPNAGFTTGEPWIRVNSNYIEINAAAQVDDPESVYSYYKKLIELRHTMPIVVYGKYELILKDDPAVFAYRRVLDDQAMTVLCNYTAQEVPCGLVQPEETSQGHAGSAGCGRELISNYREHKAGYLQPYEAIVTIS